MRLLSYAKQITLTPSCIITLINKTSRITNFQVLPMFSDINNLSVSLILVVNFLNGVAHQFVQSDIVTPSPVLLGVAIIERARPGLSHRLSEVRLVFDGEVRDELFH